MTLKKTALLKPNEPRANELHALARDINGREDTIAALKGKTIGATNEWICEVILQGEALNRAKAMVPHGNWLEWMKCHCPLVTERNAQRYMRIAANATRVSDMEATSIRVALQLCAESGDHPNGITARSWPPYIEALGRFSKFAGFVERHPLDKWPDEGRNKLRDELQPVATILWPEKFAA